MSKPDYDQLYLIAEDQGGYFTAAQAGEAGFSWERLFNTTKSGKFQRVSRGIYRPARFSASCFEDLHIASLRTGSRRREGIQLHTHKLEEDEIAQREGMRITSVERTIDDVIV